MNPYMNNLLAMEIHKVRQQEIVNQLRLQELLGDYHARRRETLKRLLGLLRPMAMMHLLSLKLNRPAARGL